MAYSSAVGAGPFVSEIFGDAAQELRLRGGDKGEFGVLPGHSTLLSLLGPGVIEVTKEDGTLESVAINWGYAEIDEHKAVILVDNAIAVKGQNNGEIQTKPLL